MNETLHLPNTVQKGQSKVRRPLNQLQTIFQYLKENIATASMVAEATGINQKNICRYKRDLEKEGRLWEVEKKRCLLTSFKAAYLTTDPKKAPRPIYVQTNLFENGE